MISGADPSEPGDALDGVRVGDEVLAERLRRVKAVLVKEAGNLPAAGRAPERKSRGTAYGLDDLRLPVRRPSRRSSN